MKYDAVTMGNHDFDAGLDNYTSMMQQHANFPVLICNYNFTGTSMEGKYQPYKVFAKGGLKIGVLGVGIELQGLVPEPYMEMFNTWIPLFRQTAQLIS